MQLPIPAPRQRRQRQLQMTDSALEIVLRRDAPDAGAFGFRA